FHYRLPNCQIDKDNWSLAQSWNTWWVVEELANQPEELEFLKRKFLAMNRPILGVSRSDWTQLIHTWAQNKNLI
ncbi:MAG: amidoligase family protein, partial [Desulfuromonadaceae bacterium]